VAGDVDELFTVAPEDFVAARNALAKSLKAAGERDEAARVAALRRPSVSDWALNVVAHEHDDAVRELLAAADRLREIQGRAIEGRGGDVRGALTTLRSASGAVHRLADEVLARAGRDRGVQAAAITSRLGEVAANAGIAAQLAEGRLGAAAVDDIDPFAGLEPAPAPKRATTERARAKEPAAQRQPAPAKEPELPKPDPTARRRLEKAAAEARRVHTVASAAVEKAEARLAAARATVAAAEDHLERARAELDDATRRVADADAALESSTR
jgi:hypothetical protein